MMPFFNLYSDLVAYLNRIQAMGSKQKTYRIRCECQPAMASLVESKLDLAVATILTLL
jgi:hypothetical protein